MPKFEITIQGVTKLLEGLNGGKASGPDELPNLILKNAANEISPFPKIIFDQSLQTGKLPDDWVEANVAPVFKKGDRHSPANYRPISLTCVCAKLLEHIICKQIMSHFSEKKILTPVQHGFRSKHSCESQLLITTDEFIQNFESKTQTDVVVLDFSKAFDVVPHQRLLHKLDHYGIRGTTLNWSQNFLTNITQKVVVDGSSSESARVRSGVPQGTVLGPHTLFDLYQWPPFHGLLAGSSLCRWLPPVSPDKMSSRSGAAAERPICVTGLGRSMGDVSQPLEMLGPEGVLAEIKKPGIWVHP